MWRQTYACMIMMRISLAYTNSLSPTIHECGNGGWLARDVGPRNNKTKLSNWEQVPSLINQTCFYMIMHMHAQLWKHTSEHTYTHMLTHTHSFMHCHEHTHAPRKNVILKGSRYLLRGLVIYKALWYTQ